ncbi:MAG TPA: hypothetical protein VFW25_01380 [Silvibacterium sp.]|nr:hypothetical protein [Silvibacterium sp.]
MNWTQLKYLTAMMLIGDGVLAMLRPHRDARTWSMGPRFWKDLMAYLSDHPDMLRCIGAAEVAVGFTLVASHGSAQERLEEETAARHARIRSIV